MIRVRGKSDLRKHGEEGCVSGAINISCKTGEGVDELIAEISKRISGILKTDDGDMLLTSARQQNILRRVLAGIERLEKRPPVEICAMIASEAICDLTELIRGTASSSGEISEEVLDEVFSRFCVGK